MAVAPARMVGANDVAPVSSPTMLDDDSTVTLVDPAAEVDQLDVIKRTHWAIISRNMLPVIETTFGNHPRGHAEAFFVRGPFETEREAAIALVEKLLLESNAMRIHADYFACTHLHDAASWRQRKGDSP